MGAAASINGEASPVQQRLVSEYGHPPQPLSAGEVSSLQNLYTQQLESNGGDESKAFQALSSRYKTLIEAARRPLTSVSAEELYEYLSSIDGMSEIAAQLGAAGVDGEMLSQAEASDVKELVGAVEESGGGAAEALAQFTLLVQDLQQNGLPPSSASKAQAGTTPSQLSDQRVPLTALQVHDISTLLATYDLGVFIEAFQAAEIDGTMLDQADAEDVAELTDGAPSEVVRTGPCAQICLCVAPPTESPNSRANSPGVPTSCTCIGRRLQGCVSRRKGKRRACRYFVIFTCP